MQEESPVVIAYYPLRARAQIPRLLCEYLHIPYVDRFFTPDQWRHFRNNQAKDWVIRDLPFLQDGDFAVVGAVGMVTYLLEREKRTDLFGRSIQDKAKFDNMRSRCELQAAILGTICVGRSISEIQSTQQMLFLWENRILPILIRHEQECELGPWYYSSFSIMDFIVYEIINQVDQIFPQQIAKFKKLNQIRDKVAKIPEIEAYEKSQRAVKEFSPIRFFALYKEEKIKRSSRGNSSASSTSSRSSNKQMDIQ